MAPRSCCCSWTQTKVGSGFGPRSTADDVLQGIDLAATLAIVTGGYSGLGLETTRALTRAGARVIVPFLADLRILRAWAGPLAATPDEMPVIGEVPEHPGLFIASGTYAFTLAPLWARVLADLMLARPPMVQIADLGVDRLSAAGPSRPSNRVLLRADRAPDATS